MIRVLIVDDDKLVRKGLASSMPWAAFGMEVVGEANNGENALAFLETNEVDLLMTDLSMPVMSGIELMRIVRVKHPHIHIVVLSLHQDFEYVQEALRLGAIDYIAKVQLEQEQFEEVLGRVVKLMEQKGSVKAAAAPQEKWLVKDGELTVFYCLHPNMEEARIERDIPKTATEAEPGIWCLPEPFSMDAAKAIHDNPNVAVVRFYGLEEMDRNDVLLLIRTYFKHDLFYEYDPDQALLDVDGKRQPHRDKAGSGFPMNRIKEQWTSADWIYDNGAYQSLAAELKSLRLPPVRLARIFFSLSDEWNRLYQAMLPEPIMMDDFFPSWHRFERWLQEVRESIRQANMKPQFSPEIQSSIAKAMHLAQQHIHEPISSSEIAQMVNMSSSYFSQCFKQYAGQTYTDYVRDIRMERAKQYLRHSGRTIQWVAEQIGYNDEKYFSRLFREHVGLLPSEYRQQSSDGKR